VSTTISLDPVLMTIGLKLWGGFVWRQIIFDKNLADLILRRVDDIVVGPWDHRDTIAYDSNW